MNYSHFVTIIYLNLGTEGQSTGSCARTYYAYAYNKIFYKWLLFFVFFPIA